MFAALDSSSVPSRAQMQAAKDAGVRMWWGYLGTPTSTSGLSSPWPLSAFEDAVAVFGVAAAYCSGYDDPANLREWANQWGIALLCLDVERGLRTDGPWVDGWCATADAGLYGVGSVHYHAAPFHVLAVYIGYDPGMTWATSGVPYYPGPPCAWQWQGTHDQFGIGVDSSWFDDAILPAIPVQEDTMQNTWLVAAGNQPNSGIWICANFPSGPKRHVINPDALAAYVADMTSAKMDTTILQISQYVLDRMPIDEPQEAFDFDQTLTPQFAAVVAAVKAVPSGPPGKNGLNGKDGPPGPATLAPHTHDEGKTGPAVPTPTSSEILEDLIQDAETP